MKRVTFLFLLAAFLIPLFTSHGYPVDLKKGKYVQAVQGTSELAVTVNLVGEKGDVYEPGKDINFSFQATKDAYVVVYNIDSEGHIHLLWPEDGKAVMSEGRKDYFVPNPGKDTHWETGDKTGVEYIHALAVSTEERINGDELYFLATNDRLSEEKQFHVDMDPFLAFNSIDEELVKGAEKDPPATDYTYFYVNKKVEYPRYLCSKCHSPEKLPDPYAMECPEIVIEKVAYDQDPHYPYPPLYDIRHVGEQSKEEDHYSSDRTGEKWLNEGTNEDYRDNENSEDNHIYLTIDYGNLGYPFHPYWPFYEPFFPVYYWDPYWWDYGWNIYGGDYWWWHVGGWYWPHYCSYSWWGCDRDEGWGWNYRHRPILAERNVTKRYIDYRRTNTELHRTRALADSRLMKVRTGDVARRLERSNLERRVMQRSVDRTELIRQERSGTRSRETERRIIYGGDQMKRESGRDANRTVRSREAGRDRGAIDTRSSRLQRNFENRGTTRTRDESTRERRNDSGRNVNRNYTPERRSSEGDRQKSTRSRSSDSSTRGRSGSSDRSSPNVERRRISDFSTSYMQRSGPAPSRYYSAPASSMSRSFVSAPAAARSAGRSVGIRSRSR